MLLIRWVPLEKILVYFVENPFDDMSHSCGGKSSIHVYDKTQTNITDEHMIQLNL